MPPKRPKLILNEESYLALNAWKIKDQLKNMYNNSNNTSLDNNIMNYHDEDLELAQLEMNNQQYDKNSLKNKNLNNSKSLDNSNKNKNTYFNEFNSNNDGKPISVRSSRIKDYEKNLRNFKKIITSDEPNLTINDEPVNFDYQNENNHHNSVIKKSGNLQDMKALSKSENDIRKNINKATKTTIIKPASTGSESPKSIKTTLPKGWHRTTDETNANKSINYSNPPNNINANSKVFHSTSLATIAETTKSPSLKRFANNANQTNTNHSNHANNANNASNIPKHTIEIMSKETNKQVAKITPPKTKRISNESPLNKKIPLKNQELLSKSENELVGQKKQLMSVLAPIEKKLDEVIKKLNDINKYKDKIAASTQRSESPYVTMPVKTNQKQQEPIKAQTKVPTKSQVKRPRSKSPKPLVPNKSRESPIRETPVRPTPARATPVRPPPMIPLPQLQPVEKINKKPIQPQKNKNRINESDNLSLQPRYNNTNGNYQNYSYNPDTRSLNSNLDDDFEIESIKKYKKFVNRSNSLMDQLSLNAGNYDIKNLNNYVPITGNYNLNNNNNNNIILDNEISILNRMYHSQTLSRSQSRQSYNNF